MKHLEAALKSLSALDFEPIPHPGSDQPIAPRPEPERVAYFSPMHYEPGYAYPLVVWLHDCGGDERDLARVMPLVSTRNYVGVALGDPAASTAAAAWEDSGDASLDVSRRVEDAVTAAGWRFNVHPSRVFLAGVGAGGRAALRTALMNPTAFAGVAAFDAGLPQGRRPLARIQDARQLPILLAVHRESKSYPERQVCRDLRLLHAAGCTLALRQYLDSGPLTTTMLSDFNNWMMELVCGAGVAVSKSVC